MNPRWHVPAMIASLIALWLLSSALYILPEGQESLVIRFGAPIRVDRDPGLKIKLPLVDSVQFYDDRLQMLVPPAEEVILGDEKRLKVETYTRYRIADPLRFYQALRTDDQARAQLAQIVSTSLRRELGTIMIQSLLSDAREQVVERVWQQVAASARPLGIQVQEVRLHRADLPLETSQAIYARMRSARQQEAKQLRAQGAEWAQEIEAEADRQRTVILSEAQRQSDIVRGQGDAQANLILARSFGRDPKFYKFYRSMQTYGHALAQSAPTLVLSPDSALLQVLKSGPEHGKP
jgi:membrane protease subunit HflC